MTVIKLNNYECEIDAYNRTTNIEDGQVISTAYANLVNNIDSTGLNALFETSITSIEIYYNGTIIYDLKNIDAELTSVNEFLNNDHVTYTININFK